MMEPSVVVRTLYDIVTNSCELCEEHEWHVHVYHQAQGQLIQVTPANGVATERLRWAEDVLPWYRNHFTMKAYRMVWPKSEEDLIESIALCRKWITHHAPVSGPLRSAEDIVQRVIGA